MECGQNLECVNCNEHFLELAQKVTRIVISSHFKKEAGDFDTKMITDCGKEFSTRLHKFEEKIGSSYIFRAVIDGKHIVYAIKNNKIIFLRAFSNFKEYGKYLGNRKEIEKQIENIKN